MTGIAFLTRGTEMRARILDLARAGTHDDEIAAILTRDGHRSPSRPDGVASHDRASRVRLVAGLRMARPRTRWCHEPGRPSVTAMAARMGLPAKWLHMQIRTGRIRIDRQPSGAHPFDDAPEGVDTLLSLRNHTVDRVDPWTHQPAQEGHRYE